MNISRRMRRAGARMNPAGNGTILAARIGGAPGRPVLSPRCGRLMARYETAGQPPVLDDPVCGRPEGHRGPCRSEAAMARYRLAATDRQRKAAQPCACGCEEIALWGHRYRRGHNPRSVRGTWELPGLAFAGQDRDRRTAA